MPLVPMDQMLKDARKEKRAVGGFMIWNYDSASAIANVAQKLGQPAIFLLSERAKLTPWEGFASVRKIAQSVADNVNVPIALHADHFRDYDKIIAGHRRRL